MVGFFDKDLDLGLFDPFKDVKDDILLEEEDLENSRGDLNRALTLQLASVHKG